MRVMVYGDSNSWGTPPDGSGLRFDTVTRWPAVMAASLDATLIEDALPGRTTVHDDPEMLGSAMNGLAHFPVALKAQHPLDLVLILLGTNDFKRRFSPSAEKIARNLGRLVTCAREIGGGPGAWDAVTPPKLALLVPPTLPALVDHPEWERRDEWRGGRVASCGLGTALETLGAADDVPVFDTNNVVRASDPDPIHLDAAGHVALGHAVAAWIKDRGLDA